LAEPIRQLGKRIEHRVSRFVRASRLDPAMPAAQQIVLLLGLVAPELFFFSLSREGSREAERLCCATLRCGFFASLRGFFPSLCGFFASLCISFLFVSREVRPMSRDASSFRREVTP
jgi:hypothetical protein